MMIVPNLISGFQCLARFDGLVAFGAKHVLVSTGSASGRWIGTIVLIAIIRTVGRRRGCVLVATSAGHFGHVCWLMPQEMELRGTRRIGRAHV